MVRPGRVLPKGGARPIFAVHRVHLPVTSHRPRMPRYFYGTVPALAWILGHYFYGGVHYAWLAEEFHPLETNPKSSNPYLIYGDLYWAWAKRDPWDKFVRDLRRSMEDGVEKQTAAGRLDDVTGARLRRICRSVGVELFYPLVYRVDSGRLDEERCLRQNSALTGSREVLIPDLAETEFDLLFTDNRDDAFFASLVVDELAGVSRTARATVLALLEGRRIS